MKRLVGFLGVLVFGGPMVAATGEGSSADESVAYLGRLELRSVVVLDGEYLFSLNDPENDRSFWIGPGENVDGVEVLAHDTERDFVTFGYGDVEKVLSLVPSRIRADESSALEDGDGKKERREALMAAWEALAAMHLRWEAIPDDLPPRIRPLAENVANASEDLEDWLVELETAGENGDDLGEILERGRVESQKYEMMYQYLERRADYHAVFEREESVRIGRAVNRVLRLYDPSRQE